MEHEKEEADSEYEERESEGGEGDEVEANNGDDKMELLEEEYKHLKHYDSFTVYRIGYALVW